MRSAQAKVCQLRFDVELQALQHVVSVLNRQVQRTAGVEVAHQSASKLSHVVVLKDHDSDAASLPDLNAYAHDHLVALDVVLRQVSVVETEIHHVFAVLRPISVVAMALVVIMIVAMTMMSSPVVVVVPSVAVVIPIVIGPATGTVVLVIAARAPVGILVVIVVVEVVVVLVMAAVVLIVAIVVVVEIVWIPTEVDIRGGQVALSVVGTTTALVVVLLR